MEAILNLLRSMTTSLPKRSHLHPGLPVSIVLKADQRTNTLTSGLISQILTAGDVHPHGIKVKLQDGQVGRVKQIHDGPVISSAASKALSADAQSSGTTAPPLMGDAEIRDFEDKVGLDFRREIRSLGQGSGRRGLQDDVRKEEMPAEERSLEDYVTFKPARQGKQRGKKQAKQSAEIDKSAPTSGPAGENAREITTGDAQGILEKEFPNADTALVAAVLGDHGSVEGARKVLKAVTGEDMLG